MFRDLFKRVDDIFSNERREELPPEEKFFADIVGYSASSKTVFLLELAEGLNNAYFVDAVGASGAGMVNYLFANDVKCLLIDEIDKMKKNDQEQALLNVMETGILSETKLKGKTRQKRMKLWIFATSNDVDRLSNPLRSRFMELHLRGTE